jgi:hypothetical protein
MLTAGRSAPAVAWMVLAPGRRTLERRTLAPGRTRAAGERPLAGARRPPVTSESQRSQISLAKIGELLRIGACIDEI